MQKNDRTSCIIRLKVELLRRARRHGVCVIDTRYHGKVTYLFQRNGMEDPMFLRPFFLHIL